ncbi:type VI secretion system tube protein TssD [Saccharicrinis fermentans]|uniref:Uncharacterized protein n=1 Tax=Saccharicrinis fermentans DSM 9555 = JCM 21142 TaxID=869213 RepID=W7Y4T0_9BACT|nr:type VI secretion system tube protein TssD [Saccharicrinis fermentans]GAF05940.1 hypothetical protein JCM21142_134705 [Saccharicrinis fermentans DSM 9555 = JCM 21142]
MFKAKLEVNGYERWLTALHYEYFCPVDINEDRYRKFLQKNFPYELSDSYNLAPYNHRSLPLIKQSLLDKELERKCRQNLDDATSSYKMEFWDCYCVGLAEHMSSQGSAPMRIHLRLSPAITRNRSVEDQKVWKVTDISPKSKAFGPGATTEELAYDELYMVDDKNNIIDDVVPGMHVDLVIKTSGCIGKSITIDLSNEKCDYKHNGEIVKDDILKNYVINQNTERVPLEVIKQQPLNNN